MAPLKLNPKTPDAGRVLCGVCNSPVRDTEVICPSCGAEVKSKGKAAIDTAAPPSTQDDEAVITESSIDKAVAGGWLRKDQRIFLMKILSITSSLPSDKQRMVSMLIKDIADEKESDKRHNKALVLRMYLRSLNSRKELLDNLNYVFGLGIRG